MKGRPVDQLVYEYMFPRPKSNDPQNFHALLQRSLIPEVRQETHAFYGHLETQEAKYPGLDYTHTTHRIRLSRWQWHRRLFRAFDGLRLTNSEIAGLTKWEGTKWAKEKFEKEQGYTIHDTAADGFPDWSDIENLPRSSRSQSAEVGYLAMEDDVDEDDMDIESEDELESVGVELNARLRDRVARREAGDTSTVLDEEWEQWLKNAIETGNLSFLTELFRGDSSAAITGLLSTARAGLWSDIPEALRPMLRSQLELEDSSRSNTVQQPREAPNPRSPTPATSLRRQLLDNPHRIRIPWPRRTYSDLRLPVGDSNPGQRAEA
ncbi:hypothetical protein ACJ41O_001897 [Fusarium nematophilum]